MKFNVQNAVLKATIAAGSALAVVSPSFAAEGLTGIVTEAFAGSDVKTAVLAAGGILIGLAVTMLGIRMVKGFASGR